MAEKLIKVNSSWIENFKIETNAGKHKMIIDQPELMGVKDEGPTALEYFLSGLAGCMISTAIIISKQKRINLKSIKADLEGKLDIDGLMGKNSNVRPGLDPITISLAVEADLTREEKIQFLQEIEKRCPVSDNILNISTIKLELKD